MLLPSVSDITIYNSSSLFRKVERAGGIEAILVLAKIHDKAWLAFSQALRSDDVRGARSLAADPDGSARQPE